MTAFRVRLELGWGLRRRLRRLGWGTRRWILTHRPRRRLPGGRLNVGCGRAPIPGWINVDLQALPGVDQVLDVRLGLPFRDLAAIYAEHFLEHLTLREALAFFKESRRALAKGGTLRLSTPNLLWIWSTHDVAALSPGDPAARAERTFEANRAFYGWEHRFLWTAELLAETLAACGFANVRFVDYGASENPELRGLERHETFEDKAGLPHVLVVEADAERFDGPRWEAFWRRARRHFLDHLDG